MLYEAVSRMPDVFNTHVLLNGQAYHEQDRVLNIRLSEGLLLARVKGNGGQIYNVHMDLKVWPRQPACCSCRIVENCKHAAAALLSLYLREKKKAPAQQLAKTEQTTDLLEKLRIQQEEKQAQAAKYRMIYLLEPEFGPYEHQMKVRLAWTKIKKNGQPGKMHLMTNLAEDRKANLRAEDHAILEALLSHNSAHHQAQAYRIRNSALILSMIDSTYAYPEIDSEQPIRQGETMSAALRWELLSNGHQQLVLGQNDSTIIPLLLDKPCYFDQDQQRFGRLDVAGASDKLQYFLQLEPVPLASLDAFSKEMQARFPDFPSPESYASESMIEVKPQAAIYFDVFETEENESLVVFEPYFIYEDLSISAAESSDFLSKAEGQHLKKYPRAFIEEGMYLDNLMKILPHRTLSDAEAALLGKKTEQVYALKYLPAEENQAAFFKHLTSVLTAEGWKVDFRRAIYQEVISADEVEWFSELSESEERSNYDFFSYRLGIAVDGERVSIVPLVVDLLNQYQNPASIEQMPDETSVSLRLSDNRILNIAIGRIKPLLRLLLQYGLRRFQKDKASVDLSPYEMVLMQEAEQAMQMSSARWQGTQEIRTRLLQLSRHAMPQLELPEGLQASLRDYQQQGLNWLQLLRQHRFGGILADDMGLGKTIQTLAHLLYEKEQGRLKQPALIIAPTSLVGNWDAEARRFTPTLKTLVFHGSDRHADNFDGFDLIISTYGLIQRDKKRFLSYPFYYLILDEAQFIKNARTKTTQIIQQLQASHRLCLSGTPLENHLGELWSLFHFLMPGLLGDSRQFRQWFRTPIEKQGDQERKQLLVQRIKPFILRRKKSEVAKELPLKTETVQYIELEGRQRDLYEAIRMSMEKKVRDAIAQHGLQQSRIILLDALLKLRQVCCDPRILPLAEADMAKGQSAKLDALMDLLENLMEEGRRVLIFSQFTSMLKLIEAAIADKKYSYFKLTGQTQNRQNLVERFQQGEVSIFLISLKAGGTGLNLNQADTVIHYDPWWNPAVEDQATDRSHRIGQDKPVFVYKLISAGTVEEIILGMQKNKRHLAEGVLSHNAADIKLLSEEDIYQFFSSVPDGY